MQVIPVILSGGSGTRLWPLSRKYYPKQLHKLTGSDFTLLQETAMRLRHLAAPIVVCNEDHRFMVADQLLSIGIKPTALILEPEAKNTAPAIALAALKALDTDTNAVIAVFPADHVIHDQSAFEKALGTAIKEAEKSDALVTFGVVPTHAETGYGYIEATSTSTSSKTSSPRKVKRFIEKPNQDDAEQYVSSPDFHWNSGMFVFKANAYIKALTEYAPIIANCCKSAFSESVVDLDFIRIGENAFKQCPSNSIDYAVLEKSKNVYVVPLDAGWSDIGSWTALWEILPKDENQCATIGDVIKIDSQNALIHSDNKDKLIVAIGVQDIIVADTPNALLIAHKDKVQNVKQAVEQIAHSDRNEHLFHREVHRPWGSYDRIDCGDRYQVKRITVKPGASLSLQMHHHRAEHWVVVTGTARVQVGDNESILSENESVYIPLGVIHRLTNPGKVALELIEVQSGSYLGEDDIVRLDDAFGRM
ncbi:mannose-1-phosphate guanylyltransferase/mannose-6-phosphate isomerase [Pseudohongiella sp. SYSU M77423]|uniref:mannose-1-phosphate guanylyltransferase/mannose-6-phosphate isomerase n=1 Tax=Pseudohongiella sp. SYSU M77423 TaxID=3042312 RepID=UPI002481828C|nr:mannose-1-phosphate guanylyltransferase/mannose-6-phosphate isomerase [Pseudohongiella sp. SYSU M77423]MDH7942941.1 mannose-1-phosphate guanylyltransferase/mannose-6-phosphate isomerase [Pseudohongiella sp. SYSU M77423]